MKCSQGFTICYASLQEKCGADRTPLASENEMTGVFAFCCYDKYISGIYIQCTYSESCLIWNALEGNFFWLNAQCVRINKHNENLKSRMKRRVRMPCETDYTGVRLGSLQWIKQIIFKIFYKYSIIVCTMSRQILALPIKKICIMFRNYGLHVLTMHIQINIGK